MGARALLCIHEKDAIKKIENLFDGMDLLEVLGHIHPEERRIHNQVYQLLRKRIAFSEHLKKYDMEMSKKTSKYSSCPI